MHRTSVNSPVQYFFDYNFCVMSGVKNMNIYKFTPDINLSVSNRLFFDTRHPHRIVRCIGRVIKIKTNQTATSHLYWPINIHPAKNNSNNTRFFYCCCPFTIASFEDKSFNRGPHRDHMFQLYIVETTARAYVFFFFCAVGQCHSFLTIKILTPDKTYKKECIFL